ncbi:MAG TPA: aminotransferase class I/II-fold pyridoxal phosphate-dependent enzyme [Candidatus Methylacidiphilales bacterium]
MSSSKVVPFSSETPVSRRSFVADHVQAIPKSGIRDFFEIVQSMGDVISLGIGEPDFVTPWRIREAAIYSLERGKTGYTSNLGLPKLRKEIAHYVKRHYGVEYDGPNEVLVTIGVSEAIDVALRAILNPGDEVIYHEPCYVSYSPSIALAFGKPVPVATRAGDGFRLRAQDIAAKITPRTKAVMLNFPCNPTGATMSREDLEPIAKLCIEHDLLVLTDEIYSELTYDGRPHVSIASLPGMRERTIFFHGFSKAFAMTGFRIGYACAPKELTEAMMKIHQYGILCASITSQEAALEALRHGHDDMVAMRDQYRARRNFLVNTFDGLRDAGLTCHSPEGAFYLFPSIEGTGLAAQDFAVRLLQEEKVAVVPGTAFGESGAGHVRCSYATGMDQIEVAAVRIANFVRRLKKG